MRSDHDYLSKMLNIMLKIANPRNRDETYDLATITDYFVFLALDGLEHKELAIDLIESYREFGKTCEEELDLVNSGFFFALQQMLQLKHRLGVGFEDVRRETFEERLKQTKSRSGL